MWHRLKNFLLNLWTYPVLSPDLRVRRRINRTLRKRPALNQSEWFKALYRERGIVCPVAEFAYTYLERYSGITFSRVRSSDRLSDLQWTSVCWYDWELQLCNDFYCRFGIDLTDCLDRFMPMTVGDIVFFLNQQWLKKPRYDGKTSAI